MQKLFPFSYFGLKSKFVYLDFPTYREQETMKPPFCSIQSKHFPVHKADFGELMKPKSVYKQVWVSRGPDNSE